MQNPKWIDRTSYASLFGLYLLAMVGVFVLSVLAFCFPIAPICWLLGIEFSNLGPIATGLWGIIIDVCIVTPMFVLLVVVKFVR